MAATPKKTKCKKKTKTNKLHCQVICFMLYLMNLWFVTTCGPFSIAAPGTDMHRASGWCQVGAVEDLHFMRLASKETSVNATLSSLSFNLWGPRQWLIADLLCGAATMPGFRLQWQTAEVCANLWAHNSSWTVEGSLSAVSALEPRALRIDVPSPIHT